jgi:hypothetical protein
VGHPHPFSCSIASHISIAVDYQRTPTQGKFTPVLSHRTSVSEMQY